MTVAPRIRLREVEPGDLQSFFEHQADPVASRMAAFVNDDPLDRSAFDLHWQRIRADRNIRLRTIEVEEQVVGHVVAYHLRGRRAVGYWIDREHWGRGVASSALASFLELETERPLIARVAADNHGSQRVLSRSGFRREIRLRAWSNARQEEIEEQLWLLE